jgi:hypothetical protein
VTDKKIIQLSDIVENAPMAGEAMRERLGASYGGVQIDDFHAYLPAHNYIFAPTREPWPAGSVNARLGSIPLFDANGQPLVDDKGKQKRMPASTWLDQNRPVEQMTWAPGLPMIIRGRLVSEGGWIIRAGMMCFNLYRPPTIVPGDATKAGLWLDHVKKVYPTDADHIITWLAHRVQKPEDKINHALLLGGAQGIGKDTILQPVKRAVGPWNFAEVSPFQALGRFNGFLKSVVLRVSETRDLGDRQCAPRHRCLPPRRPGRRQAHAHERGRRADREGLRKILGHSEG